MPFENVPSAFLLGLVNVQGSFFIVVHLTLSWTSHDLFLRNGEDPFAHFTTWNGSPVVVLLTLYLLP